MSIVITVTNQKGGVGKTTTSCALAGIFASKGYRVLAVDLDPQGNMSFSLGASEEGYTIHDVLTGKCPMADAIQVTDNCHVVPSNILLSGMELELTVSRREFILQEALADIREHYDFILLDTPPALSILTINAYTAANDLIIPMTAEILSLQGISQLKDTILAVKKYYNHHLNVRGILLTRYNARTLLNREVEEMAGIVAEQLSTVILNTKISTAVSVAEAPAHQKTLIQYAPRCRACQEYCALAEELYNI